jgi:hypothetical protein
MGRQQRLRADAVRPTREKGGRGLATQNPNPTQKQKDDAKSEALSGATVWAKNATFQHYKAQNHPADLTNELHQRLFGTPDPDFKGSSPEGGAP